jgi:hypothetical protein
MTASAKTDLPISPPFCQIVGFGPACTSFLISADRRGILDDLLQKGIVIHERRQTEDDLLLAGPNYDIPSNSDASDFLEGISANGLFAPVLSGAAARLIRARGTQEVPLQLVALLIADIRRIFCERIRQYPHSRIVYRQHVQELFRTRSGWLMSFAGGGGLESTCAILACGSTPHIPPEIRRAAETSAIPLLHSETLLRPCNLGEILPESAKHITVIGASHSAFSVLHKLLEAHPDRDVRYALLHQSPVRRMHRSAELALVAGEVFDPKDDICPVSGRVFRFQGLYTRSRRLYEQIVAGRHPSVALCRCNAPPDWETHLRDTDVIVAATGYRPSIPMMRGRSANILRAGRNGSSALVDRHGNLCDPLGKPISGLLGLGLGFGRNRSDIGEPSYRGSPVGINIFQGPDGDALCENIRSKLQHNAGEPLEKEYF